MVFDLKDYKAVKAMIKDIGKEENILWQSRINPPNINYSLSTDVNVFIKVAFGLLVFSLLLSLWVIHLNVVFFLMLLLLLGYKGILFFTNVRFKKEKKKFFQYTEYLITEQRILFILYQNNKLYLYFIPFANIKQVEVSLINQEHGSLNFTTYHPVSFQRHFDTIFTTIGTPVASPTSNIRFAFIKYPQKTALIIQSYL